MLIPVVGGPYHGEFVEATHLLPIHEFPPKIGPYAGLIERYKLARGADGMIYKFDGTYSLRPVRFEEP